MKFFSKLVFFLLDKIFNKKKVNVYFVSFLVKERQKTAIFRIEINNEDAYRLLYDEIESKVSKKEGVEIDNISILSISKIN